MNTSEKNSSTKCCKCEKKPVIIDKKEYYCALHYCYKYRIPKLSIQLNKNERTTTNTNF